ncbi:AsmA family protein [Sphingomonas sp.]|uniref:AsmA family protein n=1 Tax=Sphingomonas sp. TaxID=28214 RepID=UPI003B3AEA0A
MPIRPLLARHRALIIGTGAAILLLLLAALLVLSFGWTWLRRPLELQLSRTFGRPVTVAMLRRTDHGFLHPVIEARGIRIAQPDWVGGGDMARIDRATVRLPLIPLLAGQVKPESIELDGLRVNLVRRDATLANWKGLPGGGGGSGGSAPDVRIRDGILTLNDAKRDHRFTARVEADARGLHLAGRGSLSGTPSTIALRGAPIGGAGPWPFRFDYRSAIASGTLIGQADKPLDVGHFSARATAWGDDLAHLDLLIEAGLPGTQPVRLTANLRHDRPDWRIDDLKLKVGRSDFAGSVTVRKRDGRSLVEGAVLSRGLDFNDLASNAGLARAAAKRRATGPRVVPDTRIDLAGLRKTDGNLRFDVRRLLGEQPSALRGLKGTLTLDHGVLTAEPLTAALTRGAVRGRARVEHASGTPRLSFDLRMTGARLEDLVPTPDRATGSAAGRAVLAGNGETIRSALADASGHVALVVRDGDMSRRNALFLGADAGRALFEGKDARAPLHCVIAGFSVRNGIARTDPLVIDTAVSRLDGGGTVSLIDERLALSVRGRPKLARAVAIKEPIEIRGSISEPELFPPDVPKTIGTALRLIGDAIKGGNSDPAPAAPCAALARRALR